MLFDEVKAEENTRIFEAGCNDGPLLSALTNKGYSPIGIDPASNIVKLARAKNIKVINDFYNENAIEKYDLRNNQDVIISCNSFAHISHIREIAETVSDALADDGIFIIEVQSLFDMLQSNAFDFVYHEHKYYYSIRSISHLLKQFGLNLIDEMKIDTQGESYRLIFSKKDNRKSDRVASIEKDKSFELGSADKLINGVEKFMNQIAMTGRFLRSCKNEGKLIVGFGASGRANMILHYLGANTLCIDAVFDESPERIGRNMGFTGIQIRAFSDMSEMHYDCVIILAWNYALVVLPKLTGNGKQIVVPLPSFRELI